MSESGNVVSETVGETVGSAVPGAVPASVESTQNKQVSENSELEQLKVNIAADRLILLAPEDIVVPESLDVRPWSGVDGGGDKEIEAIQNLAETISEEGQINPVKLRLTKEGMYELIAGRRRVSAISLINAGKKKGEVDMKVKCIVRDLPLADPRAFRQAMIENIHRKNLSPMDLATDIATIQKKFGWEKSIKKVSEFLKVSPATVTQHLKLLELPEELKKQVHDGVISRDAAFTLAGVKSDKVEEVVNKAKELQAKENESKPPKLPNKTTPQTATQSTPQPTTKAGKPDAKRVQGRDTGTVKARHVKAAARETEGATDKPQPRTRKEIIEFFDCCEGPRYGHADGAVQTFVRQFRLWAAGKLTDRTLEKYFDTMVEKADRGTSPLKAKK